MPEDRACVARVLPPLRESYPKFLMSPGIAQALLEPPHDPAECLFAKMSTNYSADLQSRVEPCIFGGTPDCAQCGCVVSSGLHYAQGVKIAGPLKIRHLLKASVAVREPLPQVSRRAGPMGHPDGQSRQASSDWSQAGRVRRGVVHFP